MPMDGPDGTQPLPRSAHLSMSGIGGRSALYGDDNEGRGKKSNGLSIADEGLTGGADTYISKESVQAALCAAGSACR